MPYPVCKKEISHMVKNNRNPDLVFENDFSSYLFSFQLLTIHLDETDCFSAWVSAKELGLNFSADVPDTKCKYS